MGSKMIVKGTDEEIDLIRGATIPRQGDVLHIILKGQTEQKSYTVYLVEHTFNFGLQMPIGNTLITLEEIQEPNGAM